MTNHTMRLLLDVNVLVPLFDDSHVHHAAATTVIEKSRARALTENGVLRAMNLPGYGEYGRAGFEAVAQKLSLLCRDENHQFFSCEASLHGESMINWGMGFRTQSVHRCLFDRAGPRE